MNIQKLTLAISEFSKKKKSNTAYYEENNKHICIIIMRIRLLM